MSLAISGSAWLAAGAVVGGAIISANAAGDAADQMAQGGRESNALQRGMYDQTRADNAGIRARGDAAGNRLSYLMGLPGGGTGNVGEPMVRDQVRSQLAPGFTSAGTQGTWGQVGVSGDQEPRMGWTQGTAGSVDEAGLNAAIDAQMGRQQASQQAQANDPAYGSLSRNFSGADMTADPQYAQLQPQINNALQRSSSFQTSPGYQFRMDEGLKATGNSNNARNGSYSGATLKALARFGQDTASNEYGNWFNQSNVDRNFVAGQGQDAFNRFTGNQDRQYNRLAGISGSGQTATNNVNAAGAAYAQNAGNTLQGIGNAGAAGSIGSANAWSGAAQQGVNNYQQNNMLDLLRNRQSSSLYAPQVSDGGYSAGQGSAYGGNRQGM